MVANALVKLVQHFSVFVGSAFTVQLQVIVEDSTHSGIILRSTPLDPLPQ